MNRLTLSVAILLLGLVQPTFADQPRAQPTGRPNASIRIEPGVGEAPMTEVKPSEPVKSPGLESLTPSKDDWKSVKSVALIGLVSLAPAALLMFTSFVRINIVLILLRQALGSPQVPGNQVLAALALLLSLLVMMPVGQSVYKQAVQPYANGQTTPAEAWEAGSKPIKKFMIDQLERTGHTQYLNTLYNIAEPPGHDRFEPSYCDEFPLRVIAPAFLLSELTTALLIGFVIYLPFLVIDLVVSAVLSAMGLFMLPPSQVAMPLKLILFVLADGWLLVSATLLRTFKV